MEILWITVKIKFLGLKLNDTLSTCHVLSDQPLGLKPKLEPNYGIIDGYDGVGHRVT